MAGCPTVIIAFQSHKVSSSARTHTADEYSIGRSAYSSSSDRG